jgi:hypothetical protein
VFSHAHGKLCPSPRRGREPGAVWPLDQGRYWDKRERERERDVSALLTHLPTGLFKPAATPDTYVPKELTRKQLPHRSDQGPSPKETLYCATRSTTKGRPKPDLSMTRHPPRGVMTGSNIHSREDNVKPPTTRTRLDGGNRLCKADWQAR